MGRIARTLALVLGLAAALFGSLFWVFPRIGFNFQPPDDSGLIGGTVAFPVGTSLEETNRVTGLLEARLLSNPEVETVQVTVGSGNEVGGSAPEQASLTVQLVPKDERALDTTGSIVALEQDLGEVLRPFPEAELSLSNQGSGPPGGTGYTLSLGSTDLGLLRGGPVADGDLELRPARRVGEHRALQRLGEAARVAAALQVPVERDERHRDARDPVVRLALTTEIKHSFFHSREIISIRSYKFFEIGYGRFELA